MLTTIIVHVLEALAICVAIYLAVRPTMSLKEVGTMAVTITIVILLLDMFAPRIAMGARKGVGFGTGMGLVGGGDMPAYSAGPVSDVPSVSGGLPTGVSDGSVFNARMVSEFQKPLVGSNVPADIRTAY